MMALELTPVGIGTAPMGSVRNGPLWWGEQPDDLSVATLRAAFDAGVGWVDTAPFYGWGHAEEVVGRAVVNVRDEVVVLTKCGTVQRAGGLVEEDLSPPSIRAGVDASLSRLRVERIDVVQFHDPDPNVPIEESWGALAELIAAGKVGYGGLSNHPIDAIDRAARIAPVTVVQAQLNLLHPEPGRAMAAECAQRGVAFLAWSPLSSGQLTTGFDVARLEPDDFRRRRAEADPAGWDAMAAVANRAAVLAGQLGRTVEDVALAFVRACGGRPIIGARRPSEIVAAVRSAGWELSSEERERVLGLVPADRW